MLLNTSSGQTESEFHTYVQPQEHPALSAFCTELTGISQVRMAEGWIKLLMGAGWRGGQWTKLETVDRDIGRRETGGGETEEDDPPV